MMQAAVGVAFSNEQLNRVFPFYFIIDRQLQVTGYGQSLKKLAGKELHGCFNSNFLVYRPHLDVIDFDAIHSLSDRLSIIKLLDKPDQFLRGQFEYLEDRDALLFIGSPWFRDMESVTASHLTLRDFAHHDPLIDLLHVLKAEEIVNDDLKELLRTVHQQKKDLRNAAEEIKDIALFPLQNPDPIFRIDFTGKVLMSNPIADSISYFEYKEKHYSPQEFWPYLVKQIDLAVDKWSFEIVFEQRTFSFICKYLQEQNYINIYGRDITIVKEKEERLKLLSRIVEDNSAVVIITDVEGRITWVNKSFVDNRGFSLEEAIGKRPGELMGGPATEGESDQYLRQQVQEAKPFKTEIIGYTKTGEARWFRIQGQPVFNNRNQLIGFFSLEQDITQEKLASEKIRQSEALFRTVLERVGDNVWEHHFKLAKTTFSKPYYEFLGYPDGSLVDEEGMLWWKSVSEEDLYVLRSAYEDYQSGLIDTHSLEYRIRRQDGTIRWILDRGVVIEKDETGSPLRSIGTHTDITRIKQTEIELEQRVKQFRSLSESIPGVIYEYEFRADGTDGLKYVSPVIEKMFGIKAEEFKNYMSFLHPDDRERVIEKNRRSRETLAPFYDESRLVIPGTGIRWHAVHSSYSYTSQTGSIVFTGFILDITERKMAEEVLKANEEKYRTIIANMNLGLLEVDTKGIVTYANKGFSTISGYSPEELVGREAAPLFLEQEGVNLLNKKFEQRRHGIADAYLVQAKNKNKEERWWLISGAPRYNDKGELVGSVGIHLDITEQKRQEAELVEAKIQAEQLARTKEMFLANMSHEIRTPMNAVLGMSNQLAKTELDTKQQFYLDTIISASENLLVIINDILDLSKIDAGKLSLETIGFELQKVADRAVQVLSLKAEEKGLRLVNTFFDQQISPVLLGDPFRLNQILLNLIGNAIKFTEKGTVSLKFFLEKDEDTQQTIKVSVEDTGVGMDENYIEHLFDKFSQENESITRQYGGTGLGMSICRELVELMGGTIGAVSAKGKGTIIAFTITLKKGRVIDLPVQQTTIIDKRFLRGKKILVTDDNELNRLVASIIIKSYGGEITEAADGEQALELLAKEKFDVVLMDIQMPGISGLEAAKQIRSKGNDVAVIALTAGAVKGEREKCIAAGMNDYISKPFREHDFLTIVNKWLPKQEAQPAKIVEPAVQPLYDLSELEMISKNNPDFIKKMCAIFCEQVPPVLAQLNKAYHTGDLKMIGEIAHRMKPSLANLKIHSLKEVVASMEKLGRGEINTNNIEAFINQFTEVLNAVVADMKKKLEGAAVDKT
ncbi:PAS domain S-box protein [Mucilaginibacter sp. RS28]|uniref:PAS domain S-box protein n=1 Tax=Mucilaginibacter straminoryzae TaxID=2932774 RepID=A0A9X2BCL8_9SPHI|nr:PAS domain S-box protein [Mucilaginibacter straminoryzae]MCJ8211052.1 PAS domain S-box protein [Mucilaginibacter straminoryzae]